MIFFSRHERVAASASSNAFTPSSTDVRTVFTLGQNFKEVRHLGGVGGAVAFKEEWFRQVVAYGLCRVGGDVRRAYVASLEPSLLA
jgi:hypothetical protein